MLSVPAQLLALTGPIFSIDALSHVGQVDVAIVHAARGTFVLKTHATAYQIGEMSKESDVLTKLGKREPPVAQAVGSIVENGVGWFLFTYLPGKDMTVDLSNVNEREKRRRAELSGQTLHAVHGWEPDGFARPDNWLTWALDECGRTEAKRDAGAAVEHGGPFFGRRTADALAEVKAELAGQMTDWVFGHGDYCLPNVLTNNGTVSGVIDWSWGGWADRRFDLGTALYTLRRNLGDDYLQTFLDAYGYNEPLETLRAFEGLYALL